ncbi:MAG: hypothetical protein COV33_01400 [Candidatus Zambryskibacteria bacterium CG10_big_fil_rev_8_21_14_0_10_34_34]|uniref:Uncharacterized protein n=1 Tax=Candidatus Zambryskibacteria bacterium CG10_big_fil_rev_8_21_14_0_10_34_34 TaxID=1975114 RepID=A0A2H0R0W3_9BACT|nr:MAG: hypothetical protein COV33_01400 [Candidatus Zambryskibacteria bacterium CG10_big_fil_rev_8_21_14_0_10_34_34]
MAQNISESISNDGVAYASVFADNFSLLLSIVIGIIATFFVFRVARKLGGGLFGLVLNYVGIGMLFVVLGTIVMVVDKWVLYFWINVSSTVFFAIGYIFMVIGANKLFKGIMNT